MFKLLSNIVSGTSKPDGYENPLRETIVMILVFVVIFGVFIFLIKKFYNPKDDSSNEENSPNKEESNSKDKEE